MPKNAQQDYQKRWQIEISFKAMKSSRFDIEKTHLQDIQKNRKINITCYSSLCAVL
mgnify:CR=1 FL=1